MIKKIAYNLNFIKLKMKSIKLSKNLSCAAMIKSKYNNFQVHLI